MGTAVLAGCIGIGDSARIYRSLGTMRSGTKLIDGQPNLDVGVSSTYSILVTEEEDLDKINWDKWYSQSNVEAYRELDWGNEFLCAIAFILYPEYKLDTYESEIEGRKLRYRYNIERFPRSLEPGPPDSDPVYKYEFHKWELNGAPMPNDVELTLNMPSE
ncbi:MAG: hypothetical protein SXQ77_08590 [Halobacteria archaeon]|nr:hypothetical protein [Halobacteria archaeon]